VLRLSNSGPALDSLEFWHALECVFSCLSGTAQDYLCAPASQAIVGRIFSVCGLMTAGRRNRMDKALKIRVLLQLNSRLVWLIALLCYDGIIDIFLEILVSFI
jgi:hAT family C-terminal dimerisation region